jgi:hypothetical protein
MDDTQTRERVMSSFETIVHAVRNATIHAMDEGDFQRVHALASFAEDVRKLEDRAAILIGNHSSSSDSAEAGAQTEDTELVKEFPRFYRREDVLVKEAVRGDGVTTYKQRMPLKDFKITLSALQELAKTRDEFRPPTVVQQTEQPSYLIYIVLNLLLKLGLLDKPKSGLYRFTEKTDLTHEDLWAQIPDGSDLTDEAN